MLGDQEKPRYVMCDATKCPIEKKLGLICSGSTILVTDPPSLWSYM